MTTTIYADSNIYRYVASGELEITTIGSIRFAYSSVHFDEMIRSGNTDMLRGIEALRAVPLVTNENGEYDIDDIGICLEYEDPYENYKRYKVDIEPTYDAEDSLNELLLRFLGADNIEELRKIPSSIIEMALDAAVDEDIEVGVLVDKAHETAEDLGKFIEKDLSKQQPLTETRKAFGFPKGVTSTHGNEKNPINGIWEHMKDKVGEISKDQFFGFEAIPGVEIEESHLGSVSGCHLILNMVGFHPDKGLPKRDKIRNIMSDGQHVGYAALCGGFLTSDYRLYEKAKAIFGYRKFPTTPIHIPYKAENMSTTLVEPGALKRFKLERSE